MGSVLSPLLFNIYLNDLLYLAESTEVCNFADGTTLVSGYKHENIWTRIGEVKIWES